MRAGDKRGTIEQITLGTQHSGDKKLGVQPLHLVDRIYNDLAGLDGLRKVVLDAGWMTAGHKGKRSAVQRQHRHYVVRGQVCEQDSSSVFLKRSPYFAPPFIPQNEQNWAQSKRKE
ncbi:hypothetical protein [Paracoccus sp. Ld10]|uniref:hypothetical protein n=1 Tax=Paracoccus sp. Ld10 TaxID=649158 RepID=UPI00386FA63B